VTDINCITLNEVDSLSQIVLEKPIPLAGTRWYIMAKAYAVTLAKMNNTIVGTAQYYVHKCIKHTPQDTMNSGVWYHQTEDFKYHKHGFESGM